MNARGSTFTHLQNYILHVVRDVRVLWKQVPQGFIHAIAGVAGFPHRRLFCGSERLVGSKLTRLSGGWVQNKHD